MTVPGAKMTLPGYFVSFNPSIIGMQEFSKLKINSIHFLSMTELPTSETYFRTFHRQLEYWWIISVALGNARISYVAELLLINSSLVDFLDLGTENSFRTGNSFLIINFYLNYNI